ncbi:MAG: carbohydrate ABC transporter permease [Chloroflexota bacterium]|nr:carbohydrate ABC transporter permease [Chloroflexota bacterium]MDE2859154.1 carbohydrate ABC transporter permease [Chloroflexota bacterium]MDE2952856.1 carbohydrate ABC transporter permease [Chloroflexota bacterium]
MPAKFGALGAAIARKTATYIAFFCLLFWVGFPVYYMLITSFMDSPELGVKPPHWIPQKPTIENYREVVIGETGQRGSYGSTTEFSRMMPALLNSTFVSVAVVLSNLLIGGMAAYGFSRFDFRFSRFAYLGILMTRVLPALSLIVPLFIILRKLKLINTLWALIFTYTIFILPLTIWILREYFDTLARDIEEMALIDGATRWQAFRMVVAPLAVPGLIAVGVMSFMEAWSEFFFALTLTNSLTYPPLLMSFRNLAQVNWNALAAATTVGVLPPVIVAFVFQRYLVRGLSEGAVKG